MGDDRGQGGQGNCTQSVRRRNPTLSALPLVATVLTGATLPGAAFAQDSNLAKVRLYTVENRPLIEGELTKAAVEFIQRIEENTIVVWVSDNAAAPTAGPFDSRSG